MNANDLWIKVNRRDLTPEEEKALREKYEIDADDEYYLYAYDNLMPKNRQKIIITYYCGASCGLVTATDYCYFDGATYRLKMLGSWNGVLAWQPFPSAYTAETHITPANAPETSKGIKLSTKEQNDLYGASNALISISERMTENGISELEFDDKKAIPKKYSAGMLLGIARALYEIEKAIKARETEKEG